jgi:hypothetical protein
MLALCKKIKATSTFPEWTIDKLAAVNTSGTPEGADVTSFTDKFAGRARVGNFVQTWTRDWMVSNIQEAVDSVGPAKKAAAIQKSVQELKRDIEATICSSNARAQEDGAGTAYAMAGFGTWIASAGPSYVPAQYRTPSTSIHSSGALTETIFRSLITSVFRKSGSNANLTGVFDTAVRAVVSEFTRAEGSTTATSYYVTQAADSKKITFTVSLYDSDHGMISIVNMNPDCAPDTTTYATGFLVDPAAISFAELRPVRSRELEDQGGGPRGLVDCTGTLIVNHPQKHGLISDVTA